MKLLLCYLVLLLIWVALAVVLAYADGPMTLDHYMFLFWVGALMLFGGGEGNE